MKHVIVTTCNFESDELFFKYFNVMRDIYAPSIINQSNKNFKLLIDVNKNKPLHYEKIFELFSKTEIDLELGINNIPLYIRENMYNIQTRHDCDDWMSFDYISKIQELYKQNIDFDDEFLIYAQPTKLLYNTLEEYTSNTYSSERPSMFLTLCQKKVIKYIYQEKHNKFSNIVKKVHALGTGYVKLTVHDNNRLTTLLKRDKKIYEKN